MQTVLLRRSPVHHFVVRIGVLLFSAVLTACADSPGTGTADVGTLSGTVISLPPQETGQTSVFRCTDPDSEDFRFTLQTGPDEITLWLPERFGGRSLVLRQVRAASGAKYEGKSAVVWNKGDEALLEVNGDRYTGCTRDPQRSGWEEAKLNGVDFRAVGNEPGWHLEIIQGDRIRFVYDYGERAAITPAPEPEPEPEADEAAGRTVYHAETEAHNLKVVIRDEPCTDSMSGEQFEAAVMVELDGESFRGCGRALD